MRKLVLLAYAALALLRMLYVPCLRVVALPIGWHPGQAIALSLPLWRVGTEQIRFGLVAFEELALAAGLAIACAVLGWRG